MIQKNIQATPAEKTLLVQSQPFMALSGNVYDTSTAAAPDGWKIVASNKNNGQQNVDGFFVRIYEKLDANGQPHYAVAFRGTDKITDIRDVGADAKIALLKLPHQYDHGVKFVADFCREKNIDPSSLSFTGHSLGGYLAATVGTFFNSRNIWTFNAPAPDAMTWNNIASTKSPTVSTVPGPGWVQIRSNNDLISKGGDYKGATTVSIDTAGSPHGLGALREGAVRITEGKSAVHTVSSAKSGVLSRVFNTVVNNVSRKLATSMVVGLSISFVMAAGPGDRPRFSPLQSLTHRKPVHGLLPRPA